MTKNIRVAVLGAGNMGTALASVIARNGWEVKLWNYEGDPEPLRQIARYKENKKYLPGIKLSPRLVPEPDLKTAVKGADAVFFVLPSNFMSALIARAGKYIMPGAVCADASKGMDEKSLGLVPDIIYRGLHPAVRGRVVSVSGPAIAADMAAGGFTAMNVAGKDKAAVALIKKVLENKNLRLTATADMVGVEVAGSFKNVYAIAMGLCDGLKLPMNTKAALLVKALGEIGALVKKMGGRAETVYGLAGLGDLVGTGLCAQSRNRRFGETLVVNSRAAAKKIVGQTVEGVNAVKVLMALGKKHRVRLPFAAMVYEVVWQNKSASVAVKKFLSSYNH